MLGTLLSPWRLKSSCGTKYHREPPPPSQNYQEALQYIGRLPFEQAESNMKRYGKILMHHVPNETTELLKVLCTVSRPSGNSEGPGGPEGRKVRPGWVVAAPAGGSSQGKRLPSDLAAQAGGGRSGSTACLLSEPAMLRDGAEGVGVGRPAQGSDMQGSLPRSCWQAAVQGMGWLSIIPSLMPQSPAVSVWVWHSLPGSPLISQAGNWAVPGDHFARL